MRVTIAVASRRSCSMAMASIVSFAASSLASSSSSSSAVHSCVRPFLLPTANTTLAKSSTSSSSSTSLWNTSRRNSSSRLQSATSSKRILLLCFLRHHPHKVRSSGRSGRSSNSSSSRSLRILKRGLGVGVRGAVEVGSSSSVEKGRGTSMEQTIEGGVIVGAGRVGQALEKMGLGRDVLVRRGEKVPEDSTGPIFVCTRNDDLDAVLQATPPSRREGNYLGHFSIRLLLLCCDHSSFPLFFRASCAHNHLTAQEL